jgi:hypothetical protein
VTARRLSDKNVPETISSSASASAVVATDLALQSSLSHAVFTQSGSVPPKADHETTYTVTWLVGNSSNAIANATVSAVLPSYVRYVGQASPGEDVSYNAVGGILTWKVGDIAEGAARSASFLIGITPSVSQVGTSPVIVSDQRATGIDRFTGSQVQGSAPALTTQSGTTLPMGNVVP